MTVFLLFVPSMAASAMTLDEILERGRNAAFSGEQMISCATPDGFRGVLTNIRQSGGAVSVSSPMSDGGEVSTGAGGWALTKDGGVVSETNLTGLGGQVEPIYQIEEIGDQWFYGRDATGFRLWRDDVMRAEMVLDAETGAIVRVASFDDQGQQYCLRRFLSFDPTDPLLTVRDPVEPDGMTLIEEVPTDIPLSVAGFTLLDRYRDEGGLELAYYSDGFFSFALFNAPVAVDLESGVSVLFGDFTYMREFSAGQVTYGWQVRGRGMALVGDLPPDLHDEVLSALPRPADLGFLHRIWRNLFGVR